MTTPNTFFTSDLHFNHAKMLQTRHFFYSVDQMNEYLVDTFNSVVSPRDTVYLLGDLGYGDTVGDWLKRMNGHLILIKGNHDHRRDAWNSIVMSKRIYDVHDFLFLPRNVFGRPLTLMHYPMASWPQSQYRSLHFHGHTHGHLKSEGLFRYDVGVDTRLDFSPYSVEEMKERISATEFELGIGV